MRLCLILLFFSGSCLSSPGFIGTWQSNYDLSLSEKGFAYLKGTRAIHAGRTLTLKSDSTYIELFKDELSNGKWHIHKDSLILESDTSWFQNADSMKRQTRHYLGSKLPQCFVIKSNKLVRFSRGNFCSNRKKNGTMEYKNNFSVEILRRRD